MSARPWSRFPIICAALVAVLLAPAWADEPSVRDMASLVPIIDSSDSRCQSIEIVGYIGDDKEPGPRMRFRALYRAPDRFSLLLSDSTDGTPLVFCSDRKMFVYDPVGPAIVYSEDAGFRVEMTLVKGVFKFNFLYLLKTNEKNNMAIDLRSVMSSEGWAGEDGFFSDSLVKLEIQKYILIRIFKDDTKINFGIDLAKKCPCTSVAFARGTSTYLCLDKILLNGPLDDVQFAFPSKELLARNLPVRDVTADEDPDKIRNTAEIAGRVPVIRSVMNQAGSHGAIQIPGLPGVDWERVRENDKKMSKVLREFVPTSLQSPARKVEPKAPRKG